MANYKKKLENRTINFHILIKSIILFVSIGCNSNPCGDLKLSLKNKITTVNNKYGDVIYLEMIPCEDRYINIYLKTKNCNDSIFNSIHEILYDKTNKEGWSTLIIFDYNKKYLFSHSSRNKLFKQYGD
jgi:hypothetical protein